MEALLADNPVAIHDICIEIEKDMPDHVHIPVFTDDDPRQPTPSIVMCQLCHEILDSAVHDPAMSEPVLLVVLC